jgi:amino acid adenylation domain-containing protein
VPLDQEQPDQRMARVLTDARVGAAVVAGAGAARLAGLGLRLDCFIDAGVIDAGVIDAGVIDAGVIDAGVVEAGVVDAGVVEAGVVDAGGSNDDGRAAAGLVTDAGDAGPAPAGAVAVRAADPAYLIYTSGTTGEPKGVLVEHSQLAASTMARHRVYPGAAVFLLVSPLAFDSSVAGLWGTLSAGGTVVVPSAGEVRDPARLVELVRTHGVTRLLCVPSLYGVLLDAAQRLGTGCLATLDTVIVAGEPLPEALLARHFAVHGGTTALVNEYGPTEATVWASYRRYHEPGPVSIGGPIPGARLYVLDDERRPVPHGCDGELYIGGAGVARCYFGRPEATDEVFLRDPFAADPDARMYRTGDRVRWNDEGTLDYLGRRDLQVKIRGHRVELAAVEAVLRAAPGVRDAVVVADRACTRLSGFVVADGAAVGDGSGGVGADGVGSRLADAVRRYAADRLTPAMVPARVEVVDALPVTFAGKVDRARLQAMADAQPDPPPPAAAPEAGALTGTVAAAWAEVLGLPQVPLDRNFFELGGHSLAMFQLQDALERHTGTRPSVVALFRYTTVTAQAELISTGAGGAAAPDRRQAAARRHAARARRQVRTIQEATP